MGSFVPLVFEVLDLLLTARKVCWDGQGIFKEAGGVYKRGGLLLEKVVEAPFAGGERQLYGVTYDLSEAVGPSRGGRTRFAVNRTPPVFCTPTRLTLRKQGSRHVLSHLPRPQTRYRVQTFPSIAKTMSFREDLLSDSR